MVGCSVQVITPIRRVNVLSKELSSRSSITHCLKRPDQTHISWTWSKYVHRQNVSFHYLFAGRS